MEFILYQLTIVIKELLTIINNIIGIFLILKLKNVNYKFLLLLIMPIITISPYI